jgi:flagellar basal body-associated protein FliL
MNDLFTPIAELKLKIEKLAELHLNLKLENEDLKQQLNIQSKTIESQLLEIGNLKTLNQQTVNTTATQQEKLVAETKEKINELVKDVDNCLALLMNPNVN